MNTHIKTEEYKDKGYLKVWCDEGHYLTDWDKEDIFKFTSAKIMFCPLGYNLDNYYCITDEEYKQYMEQLDEAARKRSEEENNKINTME